MNSPLDESAIQIVQDLESQGLRRRLRRLLPSSGMRVHLEGREILNFSSNDYLGLSQSPVLIEAMKEGLDRFGVGSASSRLVCGTQEPHLELEECLARFKGAEAAIAFSSGYATSVGVIPSLVGTEDFIVLDKLSHASLIDGSKLSGATIRVFPHNQLEKLEKLLKSIREKHGASPKILVITESIFSMDGDAAPLVEMVRMKNQYGACLLLDEAHGVGILGPQGRGYAAELGIEKEVDLKMGTLSKAVGVSGGYLAASQAVIDLMIHRARSLIYSTAPSPALAFTAKKAIELIASEEGDALRQKLQENREALRPILPEGDLTQISAIFPLMVGDEKKAQILASEFLEAGYLIPAIRYPTVARGAARLRLTLSALHEVSQVRDFVTYVQNRLSEES